MQTKIIFKIALAGLVVGTLLAPAATQRAEAQAPGRHPAYVHALADLREARGYVDRRAPNEALADEQKRAMHEIDEAIDAIKRASKDDGKNINQPVEADARLIRSDRLLRAREALGAALRDVDRAEDDPYARGLQKQSLDHIHRALDFVQTELEREHHP